MTVKFPCRGCGQELLASADLAGTELACALCGEVSIIPGTPPAARPQPVPSPRERPAKTSARVQHDLVAAYAEREEVDPGYVVRIALLTCLPLLRGVARDSGSFGGVLLIWALNEAVLAGLAWSTWMRGGEWRTNVILSYFLTPVVGCIHTWASTAGSARRADPAGRSLPVLIICTLLSVVATVLVVGLLLAIAGLSAVAGSVQAPGAG